MLALALLLALLPAWAATTLQTTTTLQTATTLQAATACPCSDASLCEPLTLGKRPEIVAFEDRRGHANHGDGCNVYPSPNCTLDLTRLTTLVDWNGALPAALYCKAHLHKVRIVRTTGNGWPSFLEPGANRSAGALTSWARAQVDGLLSGGLPGRAGMRFDGINVDWEHAVAFNDTSSRATMANALSALRSEMDARTPAAKGSLAISFDTGWGAYGLPQANATGQPPACVRRSCCCSRWYSCALVLALVLVHADALPRALPRSTAAVLTSRQ